MVGIVFKKNAQNFWINLKDEKNILAKSRGKIKQTMNIFIGDYVEVSKIDSEYIIEKIIERKNYVIRPAIANVDTLMIIQSIKEPNISTNLLNTYLAFYENSSISQVCIFLTKMDLLSDVEKKEINLIVEDYSKEGYLFFSYDKEKIKELDNLFINNNIVCFAGQSGVGKSTLINTMMPSMNITTQPISKSLNRGKHTTTTTSLIEYKKGYVADTPGFSSIILNMTKKEYSKAYNIYRSLSTKCKFSDCLHIDEKDCNIINEFKSNKICKIKYLDYLETIKRLKN